MTITHLLNNGYLICGTPVADEYHHQSISDNIKDVTCKKCLNKIAKLEAMNKGGTK